MPVEMARLACLVLSALVLAGCSAKGPSAEPTPTSAALPTLDDPCSLLIRVEVKEATGSEVTTVERGVSKSTLKWAGCIYWTDGSFGAIVVDLTRDAAEGFHARLREESQQKYPNIELVHGLGDAAFLDARTALVILAGDDVVDVATQKYAVDGPALLRSLAEIALTRV
jgi:hypothetical protein